jgi:hypothetical protein
MRAEIEFKHLKQGENQTPADLQGGVPDKVRPPV